MNNPTQNDTSVIDQLLGAWSDGQAGAEEQLIESLYPEIHRIARYQLKSSGSDALQTTEIVSEAFLKLSEQRSVNWQNKNHFLAIAAKVIRRVVVDQFRAAYSQKRGGDVQHLTFDRFETMVQEPNASGMVWVELDQLLTTLKSHDEEAAKVVELKIFGGLTIPEMAEVLGMSESSVSRNWAFARSWLLLQLKPQ